MSTKQNEVNDLRAKIIKRRENQITILEKKRDSIIAEINEEKEYLEAYKKTVPIVQEVET